MTSTPNSDNSPLANAEVTDVEGHSKGFALTDDDPSVVTDSSEEDVEGHSRRQIGADDGQGLPTASFPEGDDVEGHRHSI